MTPQRFEELVLLGAKDMAYVLEQRNMDNRNSTQKVKYEKAGVTLVPKSGFCQHVLKKQSYSIAPRGSLAQEQNTHFAVNKHHGSS